MTVAHGGGVLLGMATKVSPIAAVSVKLSAGQGKSQTGVADISKVALSAGVAVGVAVSIKTAGPKETINNKIRLGGNNRKFLAYIFLITGYLIGPKYGFKLR